MDPARAGSAISLLPRVLGAIDLIYHLIYSHDIMHSRWICIKMTILHAYQYLKVKRGMVSSCEIFDWTPDRFSRNRNQALQWTPVRDVVVGIHIGAEFTSAGTNIKTRVNVVFCGTSALNMA